MLYKPTDLQATLKIFDVAVKAIRLDRQATKLNPLKSGVKPQ